MKIRDCTQYLADEIDLAPIYFARKCVLKHILMVSAEDIIRSSAVMRGIPESEAINEQYNVGDFFRSTPLGFGKMQTLLFSTIEALDATKKEVEKGNIQEAIYLASAFNAEFPDEKIAIPWDNPITGKTAQEAQKHLMETMATNVERLVYWGLHGDIRSINILKKCLLSYEMSQEEIDEVFLICHSVSPSNSCPYCHSWVLGACRCGTDVWMQVIESNTSKDVREEVPEDEMSLHEMRLIIEKILATLHKMRGNSSSLESEMKKRRVSGIKSYAKALAPFNGRDALTDLYEEILDARVYLEQLMIEKGPGSSAS